MGEIGIQTDRGEGHVTVEANTRVGHLQAKEGQIAGNPQKLGEAREGSSLKSSAGEGAWQYLEFRILDSKMMREYFCHLMPPNLWSFVSLALGNYYIVSQ